MESNRGLRRKKFRSTMLALALSGLVVSVAFVPLTAQVVTVTVQGRVYDSSGAAISQATVTAVNAATGLSRGTTANAVGDYQISLLPPGDYTITADKAGFQKVAKKIHLDIGAAGALDFSLSPGQVIAPTSCTSTWAITCPGESEKSRAPAAPMSRWIFLADF